METNLTPAQRRVLDGYMALYAERNQIPPTVREIADRVGLSSPASVQRNLATLILKGYLMRVEGMGSRGIVPTGIVPAEDAAVA